MIVITMREGSKNRRYVVDEDDEDLFDDVPDGPVRREDSFDGPQFWFGAQWLRGPGRIDEMYRSLSASDITRVKRQ